MKGSRGPAGFSSHPPGLRLGNGRSFRAIQVSPSHLSPGPGQCGVPAAPPARAPAPRPGCHPHGSPRDCAILKRYFATSPEIARDSCGANRAPQIAPARTHAEHPNQARFFVASRPRSGQSRHPPPNPASLCLTGWMIRLTGRGCSRAPFPAPV